MWVFSPDRPTCVVAVGVCSCEDDGRMLKIPAISRIH